MVWGWRMASRRICVSKGTALDPRCDGGRRIGDIHFHIRPNPTRSNHRIWGMILIVFTMHYYTIYLYIFFLFIGVLSRFCYYSRENVYCIFSWSVFCCCCCWPLTRKLMLLSRPLSVWCRCSRIRWITTTCFVCAGKADSLNPHVSRDQKHETWRWILPIPGLWRETEAACPYVRHVASFLSLWSLCIFLFFISWMRPTHFLSSYYFFTTEKCGATTAADVANVFLNETGTAFLPGSDFGFKPSELYARIAYVNFDGQLALESAKTRKQLDDQFVDEFCPETVKAAHLIAEFYKSLWSAQHLHVHKTSTVELTLWGPR